MAEQKTESLPMVQAELTPEWLGEKLGHKIKQMVNTRNIWGTGSKLFYTITYDDDAEGNKSDHDRPTHICIKGTFDPELLQAQPWIRSLALKEADFYAKIASSLNGLMTIPRGWWGGANDMQGIAIMDDLTTSGCTFAPEAAAYPVEKVMDSVGQLAGMHGKYWGQSEEDHPWIWNNYDPSIRALVANWDDIVRQPGRPALPATLMDGARYREATERHFSSRNPRFRTLLHGDPHIGNIYFTADGKVGFLDWSAFHFASCFHDIAYHITCMLSIEDRRAHEWAILDRYFDTLHANGGPRLDRNDPEVIREYRKSYMVNVAWLVCPYEVQSRERITELCKRSVAAYEDHKVVELVLGLAE